MRLPATNCLLAYSGVGVNTLKWAIGPAAVAIVLVALCQSDAYGYIDPGTGSYLLQLLIAGVLGSLFAIKVYWGKLKAFFFSRFAKTSTPPEEGAGHADGDE